jgi:hypothetical protein
MVLFHHRLAVAQKRFVQRNSWGPSFFDIGHVGHSFVPGLMTQFEIQSAPYLSKAFTLDAANSAERTCLVGQTPKPKRSMEKYFW